jgi:hypothetical protein
VGGVEHTDPCHPEFVTMPLSLLWGSSKWVKRSPLCPWSVSESQEDPKLKTVVQPYIPGEQGWGSGQGAGEPRLGSMRPGRRMGLGGSWIWGGFLGSESKHLSQHLGTEGWL